MDIWLMWIRAITSLKDWPYKHGLGVGNESVSSTAQHWAVHPHTLAASFPCTARLFNLSLNSNNANFCLSLLDLISITFLQKDCNWCRNAFCFPFWGEEPRLVIGRQYDLKKITQTLKKDKNDVESQLHYLLPVKWPWGSQLSSLSLSFFICTIESVIHSS